MHCWPSPQIVGMHSRWHLIEQISASGIRTHVTAYLHNQAVLLNEEDATGSTAFLSSGSLLEIFEVSTQQLAEVGR